MKTKLIAVTQSLIHDVPDAEGVIEARMSVAAELGCELNELEAKLK
jgi:hypothetical protein